MSPFLNENTPVNAVSDPVFDPLESLYQVVISRKMESEPDSYTGYLFTQGLDKICKKIGEECAETIIAAKNGDPAPLVGEVSDVLYHMLVLLAERGIPWSAVRDELDTRSRKIGNKKNMRETDKNT